MEGEYTESQQTLQLYSFQHNERYIQFRPSVSQQIKEIIKQSKQQQSQALFRSLYAQITGKDNVYQYTICITQQKLVQTLKHVLVFSGSGFTGVRSHMNDVEDEEFDEDEEKEEEDEEKDKMEEQETKISIKLNHIQNIAFKNIKWFCFHDCHLSTIQPLAWLDIKTVKEIQISHNDIVTLKSFNKTSFIELQRVFLSMNKFTYHSFNHLQRSHSPKLNQLFVYQQYLQTFEDHLQDLRCFMKLQKKESNKTKQKQRLKIYCFQQYLKIEKCEWKMKVNSNSMALLKEQKNYGI